MKTETRKAMLALALWLASFTAWAADSAAKTAVGGGLGGACADGADVERLSLIHI